MNNVLLVGVGGQGIILSSKVLISGLATNGYNVKMSEIHGMSQRGGAVSTHIRFGREAVYSPVIPRGTADMIVAFERMEAMRFLEYLKPNGCVLLSDQEILTSPMLAGVSEYPKNISNVISATAKVIEVPALLLANSLGNEKVANTVLVGAALELLELAAIDWNSVIETCVKQPFVSLNMRALELGRNEVQCR